GFGLGRGALTQTLFHVAVPPSLRRGDVEILIAQQQLNLAVVEQLHAARLAFYAALYNRSLESIRGEQQRRLQENVATQKTRYEAGLADRSAFTSATVQAYELDPGIHREGSTSRNQDFIGSEIREKAAYTWRVVDNGKVGGAVLRARSAREINELTCRKLEANVPRELSRIANDLKTTEVRERSLAAATAAAEESARIVQQNLTSGLASPLEYRITQNGFLQTKSGLLDAIYQHNLAVAEWDRATGRYFQFSDDTTRSQ